MKYNVLTYVYVLLCSQAAIAETVQKLIDAKQSAELNPTKMDSPDDACNNAEFLLMILDQVRKIYYLCRVIIVILLFFSA